MAKGYIYIYIPPPLPVIRSVSCKVSNLQFYFQFNSLAGHRIHKEVFGSYGNRGIEV